MLVDYRTLAESLESRMLLFGFDYPFDNGGYKAEGQPNLEVESSQKNDQYRSGQPATDNPQKHDEQKLAGWYNLQDVGEFNDGKDDARFSGIHPGEDWNYGSGADDVGKPVYAAADGKIIRISTTGTTTSQGWTIIILHEVKPPGGGAVEQFYTLYEHVTFAPQNENIGRIATVPEKNKSIFGISENAVVRRGDLIAVVADKTASHLHFEMRKFLRDLSSPALLYPKTHNAYFTDGIPPHNIVGMSSMTKEEAKIAYSNMKTDEGIIDPSDFIDGHRPNLYGTLLAKLNTPYPIQMPRSDQWAKFYLGAGAGASLTIQSPPPTQLSVAVFDTQLKLVAGQNLVPGITFATLDLSTLAAGPYFVKVTESGTLTPITLTLAAPNVSQKDANVVEVIDVSTSMDEILPGSATNESKLAAAKRAAGRFANLMGSGDRIGVVAFSGSAFSVFDPTLIEPNTSVRAGAIAAIDALSSLPTGTGIGYGIAAAGDQLNQFPNDKRRAIILLTDGQENQGPDSRDIVNQLPTDVRVFTIGFGSDVDTKRLSELAGARPGDFFNAATATELQKIYQDLLGVAAGQQAFSNLSLTIAPGGTTSSTVTIDSSTTSATFGINWPGSNLELTLTTPGGQVISKDTVGAYPGIELVTDDTSAFYRVDSPQAGQWRVDVLGVDVPHDNYPFSFFALGESPIAADLSLDATSYVPGQPVLIRLDFNEGTPIAGATVVAHLTPPTDDSVTPASFDLPLYDDGVHGDDAAGDGVYANTFTQGFLVGTYGLTVNADGASALGFAVSRSPSTSFAVTPGDSPALFAGDVTITQPLTGNGTVSFPITLSEPLSFDVSVDYTTIDGTATAGPDYTAASGTVTIPAGLRSVSVPVQVVGTVLSSTTKTFSLALQNSADAPIGRAIAVATLVPTGLTTVNSTAGRATYTDAAGRSVIVQLAGPGSVQLAFPAGFTSGNPAAIVVTGSTNRSILLIRALGGFTTVGGISVDGSLGALVAPAVNLLGGLTVSGSVTRLLLHDVTGPAMLDFGGGASIISIGTADNLDLRSVDPIRAIIASQWLNSDGLAHVISAPSIGALLVNGPMGAGLFLSGSGMDLAAARINGNIFTGAWNIAGSAGVVVARASSQLWSANVAGDIASLNFLGSMAGSVTARSIRALRTGADVYFASIHLTSPSTATTAPALGTLLVAGSILNSRITSVGSVRAVLAGGMENSSLLAGVDDAVTGLPSSAGDFVNSASIGSFAVRARGVFSNSYVAAASVSNVVLGTVQTQNAGTPFGLAMKFLTSIAAVNPRLRWFNRLDPVALAALPDDFRVSLI